MVPIRTVCLAIGAGVKRSRDGRQWTVTRGTDRLDCNVGTPWFTFNGVRQTLSEAPEARDQLLFVPIELIQSISGGGLEIRTAYSPTRDTSIFLGNRLLHYKPEDVPFRQYGTVFVSLRATAGFLGAKVDTKKGGVRMTITRTQDQIVYEVGSRWFQFNGVEKTLRAESVTRGKIVFVPIDFFQAFVGEELSCR
jgi:uncharacterized protein YodC (DUF2158 family)